MSDEYFPSHLLNGTVNEKIDFFRKYVMLHPFFIRSLQEIMDEVEMDNPLMLIFGPTGVGKTELMKVVKQQIIKKINEFIKSEKGIIPIIDVEAAAPDKGIFDWRDFYIRALEQAREPLIEYKVDYERIFGNKLPQERNPNSKWRRSLENALKYRKTLAFLVDEAHHMTFTSSGKRLNSQVELIKSFASLSETPFLLFGTYSLIDFMGLSGQLSRRTSNIHFPRYNIKDKRELEFFQQTLWNFQKVIPLPYEPDLINNWRFFYEKSVGCIGILKSLILRTLKFKLQRDQNSETLEVSDFENLALPVNSCYKITEEAIEGEKLLIARQEDRNDYLSLLGLSEENSMITEEKGKPKGNRVPGVRKPHRDTIDVNGIKDEEGRGIGG